MDTPMECIQDKVSLYQNIIGLIIWVIDIGCIEISFEFSALSRYLAFPRTGYLVQALHVFKYLEIHDVNDLAFKSCNERVTSYQSIQGKVQVMKDFYVDAGEETSPNDPNLRGKPVQVNCFVDSDHAGDRPNQKSHTGIILYCNPAPIIWYSKRHNAAESSKFGAEFVALLIVMDLIVSFRYKLRMIEVPIEGAAMFVYANESVYIHA